MKVAGVIVAGGVGSRMGGAEKLLLPFSGGLLIERLLDIVMPQVDVLALNVRRQSRDLYRPWTARALELVYDPYPVSIGPLGGVVAGLEWLGSLKDEYEWLATFPGDTPVLPNDLVARLVGAVHALPDRRPAVVHDGERIQSLCALWPRRCLADLRASIEGGEVRSVQRALSQLQCIQVKFEDRKIFMNINIPEDLDRAAAIPGDSPAIMFDFEKDFVGSLRCIPMAVRLKLDQSGVKLSLRQWSRFTREDRARLLEAPCATPPEIRLYRTDLIALVAARTGETAKDIDVESSPAWGDASCVPAVLGSYSASVGIAPPTPTQWAKLSPLQRFALVKLTRESHDNVNFRPAMIEFGLLFG